MKKLFSLFLIVIGVSHWAFEKPDNSTQEIDSNTFENTLNDDLTGRIEHSEGLLDEWGIEGDADGEFNYPIGIVVDGVGRVYVSDQYNNRIQVFDPNGRFLRKWGSEGERNGEFNLPFGIAVDGAGNVYVSDEDNMMIQAFDPEGRLLVKWDYYYNNGDGGFPSAIAVDGEGKIYIADILNHQIQVFSRWIPLDAS